MNLLKISEKGKTKLTLRLHVIFLCVLISITVFSSPVAETANMPDTAKLHNLLQKGIHLHFSHPDSALFYYDSILKDYNEHSRIANKDNYYTDFDKKYLIYIIEALNRTGNIYYYRDEYIRAESYYQQSLKIAKKANLMTFIGKSLYDIGYIRYVNNDFVDAIRLFDESNAIYSGINDSLGMYRTLNASGLSDKHLGNFKAADTCFLRALMLAKALHDSTLISDIKIHLGILYCEQEKFDEGMILFKEALDFYEKTGNRDAVSDALLNMGVVMKMVGENEKALSYIEQSTKIEEIRQVKSQLVNRYYNLADLYLQMNNNKKAHEYCRKTLMVAEEIASKPFLAECNFLMGKYYFKEEDFTHSIRYFETALENAEKSNDKTLITNIYQWFAQAYLKMGNYQKALKLGQVAFNNARQLNLIRVEKEAAYTLFKSYEEMSDMRQALRWFERYHNFSDSIRYFNQQKEIKRIEARYDYKKKEQENELLRNKTSLQEQKLKNRSVTLFALLLGVVLSVVVIVLLIYRIKYNRARSRQQQMESLKKLENLNNALEGKDRELTSKMMFLNQKTELIGRIINQLQELQNSPDAPHPEIHALVNQLRSDSNQTHWKEFEAQFVQVHPDFYKRLFEKYPDLTSYEQRICAFLRMNLNTKEISSITGRSAKSIEVTRSRIRKKLNLSRKDNLSSFLASI